MRVALVCPAPAGSRLGNRITALRWSRILRALGHTAFIASELPGLRELAARARALGELLSPANEEKAWEELLVTVAAGSSARAAL